MKSFNNTTHSSVISLAQVVLGLAVFGVPLGTAFAQVPPPPTYELPTISEVPTPPPSTPEAPNDQTSTTTETVSDTTAQTSQSTTVSGGGGSSTSGGGSSSRRSGGGGGGSSRSSSSASTKVASASTYSTAVAAASVKCSGPTRPASDVSGDMTLAGLIDFFVALGIIPQDRAAKACAALASADTTTTSTVSAQAFTKTLSLGETHADVIRLQQFLNARGFTVATQGLGSKGQESSYYGVSTGVAVARFQEAYRTEILTPRGLQSGTGNFDQATMTKVNQLLGK